MSRILTSIPRARMSALHVACTMPRKAWCTAVVLLLLITGCNSQKRLCKQAERHVAIAVYKCPDILSVKRDTVFVQLPADSARDTIRWRDTNTDSLLAACDSLRAAAESIALNSLNQSERFQQQMERQRRVERSVQAIRQQSCRIMPLHLVRPDAQLHVWWNDTLGQLQAELKVTPRPQVAVVNTREVNPGKATITGVAAWYRTGFWLLLVLCVLVGAWVLRGRLR